MKEELKRKVSLSHAPRLKSWLEPDENGKTDEEKVKEMYNDGEENEDIAFRIGRTIKAVENKLSKMRAKGEIGYRFVEGKMKSSAVEKERRNIEVGKVKEAIKEKKMKILDEKVEIPVLKAVKLREERVHEQVEDAGLIISDLHFGAITKKFNKTKVPKLIKTLIKNILTTLSYLYPIKIKRLNLFLAGDILTGETIFRGQSYSIDMTGLQQWRIGVKWLGIMIRTLAKKFERIDIYCVLGNHGKVGRDAAPESNWDMLVYYALELALKDLKNVKFHISGKFYQRAQILGHKFLIIHGDEIGMTSGMPYNGITRAVERWQSSIGEFDVLIAGHFHIANVLDWNGIEILINGCSLSDDPFSLEVLKLKPSAKQLFFGISRKRPVTWLYKIDCEV